MKKYNTEFIHSFIEKNREYIDIVNCGMAEDWGNTADIVYCDGKFLDKCHWNKESITVDGISGSIWATPVMQICYKDGRIETKGCWFDDGTEPTEEQKRISDMWRKDSEIDSVCNYGRDFWSED